jgi:hypothetical protein
VANYDLDEYYDGILESSFKIWNSYENLFLALFTFFRKIVKWTISFFMSVRMEQLVSHWRIFMTCYISVFLKKSVAKIQILLKSDKNKGYLYMKINIHFWAYLSQFL